ncbi:sulfite exporter TauE/SafE family protein [Pelagibacteraceae bacterium]|nr:sulfite exporter TauE/SafE family protein [Pelagibacteraceae bacterium]
MLQIYLPIAEVTINLATLLFVSVVVGFFAGLLGIGGGFLLTPILIFLGIPPIYAVANGANNILAASVSGTIGHWFKDQLDTKMGILIIVGGVVGAIFGIFLFKHFLLQGSVNKIISIMYCILLSGIGISMLIESLIEIRRIRLNRFIRRKLHTHYWVHNLPFKIRIHKSKLYISIIPPVFFGAVVGILSSMLGVGGGFLLVPIMIYILGMPARLVAGTSLFVMIFIMIVVTFLHAINHNSVDIFLVLILVVGSGIGAQLGTKISIKLKGEELRAMMSLLVLIFGFKFGYDLFFNKIIPSADITSVLQPGNINALADFAIHASQVFPWSYAIASMSIAILVGVLAAFSFKKFL